MMERRIVLDPTAEQEPVGRQRPPRLESLQGITIGLLDISKARGDLFLDVIEEKLEKSGITVKRFRKPTFARPISAELIQSISIQCGAVIEALAD